MKHGAQSVRFAYFEARWPKCGLQARLNFYFWCKCGSNRYKVKNRARSASVMIIIIKLIRALVSNYQKINLNVFEEYKNECKAQGPIGTERDIRIVRPRNTQICKLRAMKIECASEAGRFFSNKFHYFNVKLRWYVRLKLKCLMTIQIPLATWTHTKFDLTPFRRIPQRSARAAANLVRES